MRLQRSVEKRNAFGDACGRVGTALAHVWSRDYDGHPGQHLGASHRNCLVHRLRFVIEGGRIWQCKSITAGGGARVQ